ncbi:hypothetical protein QJS10_CPA07g01245 [Acorus calamus]|uniref:Ubiquitinyl hydrolase 1 n=1 Tax=Acorus calamus TaxID=4465 RepID=A0AAV9EKA5_ACOCL|nr:hypothetical protein QJS10_CPA07g01245 [Acorus calamus]
MHRAKSKTFLVLLRDSHFDYIVVLRSNTPANATLHLPRDDDQEADAYGSRVPDAHRLDRERMTRSPSPSWEFCDVSRSNEWDTWHLKQRVMRELRVTSEDIVFINQFE